MLFRDIGAADCSTARTLARLLWIARVGVWIAGSVSDFVAHYIAGVRGIVRSGCFSSYEVSRRHTKCRKAGNREFAQDSVLASCGRQRETSLKLSESLGQGIAWYCQLRRLPWASGLGREGWM